VSVSAEPESTIERDVAPPEKRAPRSGLSARRRADARALAEALWSRDGASGPPADRLAYFESDLSDFAFHLNTRARLLLLAGLATVTRVAPLLIGRFSRLGALPIDERIRAIHALERTPASLALFAVKAVLSIVWFEHPDNAREMGWDQRCLRAGAPR
jgi:uncharacterized protein (DUF2236 family)